VNLGLECTFTKIQFQGGRVPAIVVGVYRPPNAPAKWFDNMSSLVNEILPLGSVIIMGDLNADLLRPKLAPCKSLKTLLALANVKVKRIFPTRITTETATCLDIIAVDKTILCLQYEVGTLLVSHHLPVIASINFKCRHALEPVIKRSLRNVNFNMLRSRLSAIQLQDPYVTPIDDVVSDWKDSVLSIIDSVAPLKAFPWRKDRCPWLTDDIRQLMDKRAHLVKDLKHSRSTTLCEKLKLVKRQIRSRIRRETKNAGAQALKATDTKKAWQFIKSATFTKNRSSESVQDLHGLNNLTRSQQRIFMITLRVALTLQLVLSRFIAYQLTRSTGN